MKITPLALFFVIAVSSCFGALSNLSQSLKETKGLLEDPFVQQNFTQGFPLESFELIEDGPEQRIYKLSSHGVHLLATLRYSHPARLGPLTYQTSWEKIADD